MDSLVPRLKTVVDDHLDELFDAGMHTGQVAADTTTAPTRWDLLETCRLDPQRPPSGPYRRISDRKVSRTDPDAAAMQLRDGRTVLGYQDHYLVDGGTARIILHAFVTPGDVAENMVLVDQLTRTMFRRKLRPRRVIADAKYATTSNIRRLEDAGIQAYVPLPEWDKSSARFKRAAFTYDPAENVYRCPQGEQLHLRWTDRKGEQWLYRARATACNACSLKEQCTSSHQGRLLRRSFHEAYLERVRGYRDTPAFKRAMRKRSVWVEGLFAEAKQWHGLHRFRLRGLVNVNIQALMVATGQNLKRWLAGHWLGPARLSRCCVRTRWTHGSCVKDVVTLDMDALPGEQRTMLVRAARVTALFHRARRYLRHLLASDHSCGPDRMTPCRRQRPTHVQGLTRSYSGFSSPDANASSWFFTA